MISTHYRYFALCLILCDTLIVNLRLLQIMGILGFMQMRHSWFFFCKKKVDFEKMYSVITLFSIFLLLNNKLWSSETLSSLTLEVPAAYLVKRMNKRGMSQTYIKICCFIISVNGQTDLTILIYRPLSNFDIAHKIYICFPLTFSGMISE